MTARRGCLNTGPSLWLLGCRLLQSVADDPRQAFTQGLLTDTGCAEPEPGAQPVIKGAAEPVSVPTSSAHNRH